MKICPFLAFFSVLLPLLPYSLSQKCHCAESSIEAKYCSSDWVSIVRVIKRENTENNPETGVPASIEWVTKYTLEWRKVFKNATGHQFSPIVYTSFFDDTCGITTLQPHFDYLLSGTFPPNSTSLTIWRCHSISEEWNHVSDEVRERLTNGELGETCCPTKGEPTKGNATKMARSEILDVVNNDSMQQCAHRMSPVCLFCLLFLVLLCHR